MSGRWQISLTLLFLFPIASAQETHNHSAPEKLGKVSFPIFCAPAVQAQFDRGVALLHSFAYSDAEKAFHKFQLPALARDMDLHTDGLRVATVHADKQIRITRLAAKPA